MKVINDFKLIFLSIFCIIGIGMTACSDSPGQIPDISIVGTLNGVEYLTGNQIKYYNPTTGELKLVKGTYCHFPSGEILTVMVDGEEAFRLRGKVTDWMSQVYMEPALYGKDEETYYIQPCFPYSDQFKDTEKVIEGYNAIKPGLEKFEACLAKSKRLK